MKKAILEFKEAADRICEKEKTKSPRLGNANVTETMAWYELSHRRALYRASLIEMLRPYVLRLFNKGRLFCRYKIVNGELFYNGKKVVNFESPISLKDQVMSVSHEYRTDNGMYESRVERFLWVTLFSNYAYRNQHLLLEELPVVETSIKILGLEKILTGTSFDDVNVLVADW